MVPFKSTTERKKGHAVRGWRLLLSVGRVWSGHAREKQRRNKRGGISAGLVFPFACGYTHKTRLTITPGLLLANQPHRHQRTEKPPSSHRSALMRQKPLQKNRWPNKKRADANDPNATNNAGVAVLASFIAPTKSILVPKGHPIKKRKSKKTSSYLLHGT